MNTRTLLTLVAFLLAAATCPAQLSPLHSNCSISTSEEPGKLRLQIDNSGCGDKKHCGQNLSDEELKRFTGITVSDLAHNGSHLTAKLVAEAGTFTCSGTVSDGVLSGEALFVPDQNFVAIMEKIGISGFDSEKLLAYAFLNVQAGWARSLKDINLSGINADNLIALRVFNVDPAYVRGITALGYPQPSADQLIGLKSQGVNPEEVRQIRALGYQPSLDELIQIRIFKITPDFIHRMEQRGLKDLTIAKLVQIRIFKLDE